MAVFGVAFVVAVVAGLCGYNEAGKIEQRFRAGPWDLSPSVCGWLCFAAALAVGLVVPVVACVVVVAFVGYRGAARYESQNGNRFGGVASAAWGSVSGASVLIGSLITSMLITGIVCVVVGLFLALLLVTAERDELLRENQGLVAEKGALVAETKASRTEGRARPATATEGAGVYSNAIASALRGEVLGSSSRRLVSQDARGAASSWSSSFARPQVRDDDPNVYELIPRSARRPQPGVGGNDFLPGAR
jgi:hypothetical protein